MYIYMYMYTIQNMFFHPIHCNNYFQLLKFLLMKRKNFFSIDITLLGHSTSCLRYIFFVTIDNLKLPLKLI